MKTEITLSLLSLGIILSCTAAPVLSASKSAGNHKMDRTILPIQPPSRTPIKVLDARDVKKPKPFKITAPEGAPNVVVVLIDDIGFGAASAFGGAIKTPTLDKLEFTYDGNGNGKGGLAKIFVDGKQVAKG